MKSSSIYKSHKNLSFFNALNIDPYRIKMTSWPLSAGQYEEYLEHVAGGAGDFHSPFTEVELVLIHAWQEYCQREIDDRDAHAFASTHFIQCSEPWFSHLASGRKTVEGRKGTYRWRQIRTGDHIVFEAADDENRKVKLRVAAVRWHATLRRFLRDEGLTNVLPGIETLSEGEAVYAQWWVTSELHNGVLAIEVQHL